MLKTNTSAGILLNESFTRAKSSSDIICAASGGSEDKSGCPSILNRWRLNKYDNDFGSEAILQ